MLRILVRSKRDADAVNSALRIFGLENSFIVEGLGGVRGEKLAERILERATSFSLILLGREDSNIASLVGNELPPFSEVLIAKTKRIRNSTVEQIVSLINKGRASLRTYTSWSGIYKLSRIPHSEKVNVVLDPQGDVWLLHDKATDFLSELLKIDVNGAVLIFKISKGRHEVFVGKERIAELYIGERIDEIEAKTFNKEISKINISLNNVVEENRDVLKILEQKSIEELKLNAKEPDTVIVPWSGGKDSTATLLLSIRAFGRDRVKALYVDTGVDFYYNIEYIEEISSKLGVDYHVYKAYVDKGLLEEGLPMPAPKNRWCTYRKILALRKGFKELSKGKTVVVVGDRDAESDIRARRPLIRTDESGLPLIAPLKLWGAAHVEAYLLSQGIPLNPLYTLGFYRIGCYICYALRGWEVSIMIKRKIIDKIIEKRPEHRDLIRKFLSSKGFKGLFI